MLIVASSLRIFYFQQSLLRLFFEILRSFQVPMYTSLLQLLYQTIKIRFQTIEPNYCYDFRNESNGIFVLGGVFSSDKILHFN